MTTRGIPDGLPVLARGKHRSPRQGACFMEMASVLANEPWSDRPRCTHPLLSQLARLVNDHTSDAGRAGVAITVNRYSSAGRRPRPVCDAIMNGRKYKLCPRVRGTHAPSTRTSASTAATKSSAGRVGMAIRRAELLNRRA